MNRFLTLAQVPVILVALAPFVSAGEGRIELELVTIGAFPFEQTRDWVTMLQKLSIENVRIHSGTEDDIPEIITDGSEKSPIYRVKGLLTPGGNLLLKGAKFKLGDRAAIGKWMDKLKAGGEENLTATPGAFGLLPKQLVAVHEGLAVPLAFSTAGGKPAEIVDKLKSKVSFQISLDSAAGTALSSAEPFPDELIGISSGTALAAVLRPAGLVFIPVKGRGDSLELKIADSRQVEKSWPVGWPPDKAKSQALPDLFKVSKIQIGEDISLEESLAAIQKRVGAPFIYDQNSLARGRVDLKTKVALPEGNLTYSRALDKLLSKVKCKIEVRVDEASKPFVWVTTLK